MEPELPRILGPMGPRLPYNIPGKSTIASWNTTSYNTWGMRPCLEFFGLSDTSQKDAFSRYVQFGPKQGAAKIRPMVLARLKDQILSAKKEAELAGFDPQHIINTPTYTQIYPPLGRLSQDALLIKLNKPQATYQNQIVQGEDYPELDCVETLKFFLLYSLECHLSRLFPTQEAQFKHLPHLERFVLANPELFLIPAAPALPPHGLAFPATTDPMLLRVASKIAELGDDGNGEKEHQRHIHVVDENQEVKPLSIPEWMKKTTPVPRCRRPNDNNEESF
jgi:hypothetical protein